MDSGLAKVINSTIGTVDFKSFDKILTDGVRIIASDEVMYVYDGTFEKTSSTSSGGVYTTNEYIVFDKSGAVYAKSIQTINDGSNNNPRRVILSVLDENENIIKGVDSGTVNSAYGAKMELFVDFNVVPDEKYKIRLTYEGSSTTQLEESFSICGRTVLFGANVTKTT